MRDNQEQLPVSSAKNNVSLIKKVRTKDRYEGRKRSSDRCDY